MPNIHFASTALSWFCCEATWDLGNGRGGETVKVPHYEIQMHLARLTGVAG